MLVAMIVTGMIVPPSYEVYAAEEETVVEETVHDDAENEPEQHDSTTEVDSKTVGEIAEEETVLEEVPAESPEDDLHDTQQYVEAEEIESEEVRTEDIVMTEDMEIAERDPAFSNAESEGNLTDMPIIYSGKDGTVTWEIYKNGTMVIRPTEGEEGTMDSLNGETNAAPWHERTSSVVKIETRGTIHLGENASSLFWGFGNLKSADLRSFDTSKVTDMSCMFFCCTKLTDLNLQSFDTSNVTDMSSMFLNCGSITSLDLESFDTSKVISMAKMFDQCHSLKNLKQSFDTSTVADMSYMFCACGITDLDLRNFNTSRCTNMRSMFVYCRELENIDLSSFNTTRVTDMQEMFMECSSIKMLDLSSFHTPKVTTMRNMFAYMSSLESIDVSNFDMSGVSVGGTSYIFQKDMQLKQIKVGEKYDYKGDGFPPLTSDMHERYWINKEKGEFAEPVTGSKIFITYGSYAGTWVWDIDCINGSYGHTYTEWKTKKLPTCAEEGYMEKTCKDCGRKIKKKIPKEEHEWGDEYAVDKEATCTEEGSESTHCRLCGAINENTVRSISKKGHTYGGWVTTKEATCTESGSKVKTCPGCGDKITEEIPATGHIWEKKYSIDKEATCTGDGSESLHCSVCGAIDENTVRSIPKKGHTYSDWKVAKEATCTEPGIREKTCFGCGDKITEEIPAKGHKHAWGIGYVADKEATCTEEGSESLHCSVCGAIDENTVRSIPKKEHTYSGWKIIKEATCTEPGSGERTCTECGEKTTEEIPTVGHIWGKGYVVDKKATCKEEGSESIHCSVCGTIDKNTVRPIPKITHSFGEWRIIKQHTDTEPGIEERTCSICGKVEQREVWEGFKITYVLNGGTNNTANPESYYKTAKITLKAPSRRGYTFAGWYSDPKFKKKVTTVSGGNRTVYAKWTMNKYSVVFNGNGATSGKMKKIPNIGYTSARVLPGNSYKRTGYTFTGWNTKADGTGAAYGNKAEVNGLSATNNSTVTLYAQWKINTYTITYNMNAGGIVDSTGNPKTYTVRDAVTLKAPTREHYTFNGWYSDKKLKKKVTVIRKGSTGNRTLYAKWVPNRYSIAYNGNGSTGGKMKNTTGVEYGKSRALAGNAYSRKGYSFAGWNTKADGSGTAYGNKASVKNLAEKNGATVTLYAQWKLSSYKITYNLNGGKKPANGDPAVYTVNTGTITLAAPSRTGYRFAGWYSDKKCKKKATQIAKGSIGDKTYYAKWTPNKYTIMFDGNGATSGGTKKISGVGYGSSKKLTNNGFKKKGRRFVGWNTKADGTGISYADKASVKNLAAENGAIVILYAQWK